MEGRRIRGSYRENLEGFTSGSNLEKSGFAAKSCLGLAQPVSSVTRCIAKIYRAVLKGRRIISVVWKLLGFVHSFARKWTASDKGPILLMPIVIAMALPVFIWAGDTFGLKFSSDLIIQVLANLVANVLATCYLKACKVI